MGRVGPRPLISLYKKPNTQQNCVLPEWQNNNSVDRLISTEERGMDRRRGNEIEKYTYYMENHIVSRLAISQLPENRYKIIIYLMQRLGHYKLLQIQ